MKPVSPMAEQTGDATPGMSLAGRLFNIYATPGDVFDEVVAAKPCTANWLVPMLLLCVISVSAVLVLFSQPAILQQVRDQQERVFQKSIAAGKMTEARAEQARKFMEGFGPNMMRITGSIGAVVDGFARLFIVALALWLMGRWAFKANFPYLKAVEVVGLANMIASLDGVVTTLLAVAQGNMAMTAGPVLLIPDFDSTNKAHLLLASLNIMTLWQIAVLSLGLAKLSRASFASAALSLYGLWAVSRTAIIFSGMGASGM